MKVLNMFVNDIGVQDIGFVTPNSEQIKVIEETTDLFAYMDEMMQKFMTELSLCLLGQFRKTM